MIVWRYKATRPGEAALETGQLTAGSAVEVRHSLRRIGLVAVDVRPARRAAPRLFAALGIRDLINARLRGRRIATRIELMDGLTTLLETGVPLDDAIETIMRSTRGTAARAMLATLVGSLQGGTSLADAAEAEPAWFDGAEAAMLRVGEARGELAAVCRAIAQRAQRRQTTSGRLVSILTYPGIVACAAVGVVVFLSRSTLPKLEAILLGAGVEPPLLTRIVSETGRLLLVAAPWVLPVLLLTIVALACAGRAMAGTHALRPIDRILPRLVRLGAVADASLGLAELRRVGVPFVDAMRIIAPTLRGITGARLATVIRDAANDIERGSQPSAALANERWFDPEYQRLVAVGETSGEIDRLLSQIAERYHRQVERRIDQLATLLEPLLVLVLAAAVGIIVLATVLPITRLQHVL